jgi:hypothetical protein
MAVTIDKSGPYAPSQTVLEIITRYRSRGLPTPVNADVLSRASVSDSLIPRTIQTLQTLDLIDATGMPTDTFESIRQAAQADYQTRLADWLKAAYAEVFAFVDPSKDDEVRIRDAFRSYQPIGQQPRMVTLFTGLCTAAALIQAKPKAVGQPRATPAVSRLRPSPVVRRAPDRALKSVAQLSAADGMPAALAGLMASLPPSGEGWTKEQRDKFMTTFGTVLDFCFPIVTQPKNETAAAG